MTPALAILGSVVLVVVCAALGMALGALMEAVTNKSVRRQK